MRKIIRIILKIVLIIVLCVAALLGGVKLTGRVVLADFYENAEAAFPTPGVHDGFVQQGFDYVEEEKAFLVAGYMVDDTASRVYVIKEDGSTTYTQLQKANGNDYTGHTGGVAHFGEYVYIKGSTGVDVFSYDDIISGKESTKRLGGVKTYNDPAHCYIRNGYLLAGSFYDVGKYENPDHEFMTTPSGDENTSIITVFKLDETFEFGIDPTPKAVISTRSHVQGMCVTKSGKVVLSTSYGLTLSQLFVYDTSDLDVVEDYRFTDGETFDFEGLKLIYLDSGNVVDVIKAPPMSEELVYLDGKIYVLSEFASNKYVFGKFTSGLDVYAYSYEE